MHIPNYSFADLLHIFFALRLDYDTIRTYEDLAQAVGVSRRTVSGWFAGDYTPRHPDLVGRLAQVLNLSQLQADLLFYAVHPTWVRYGTPEKVLHTLEIVRYNEQFMSYPIANSEVPPAISEIEHEWSSVFEDQFEHNYNRWGLGIKDDGVCRIERSMADGKLILTLQNYFHDTAFLGADSACFAPPIYYLTVHAQMLHAHAEDDGLALIFEEISDNCLAMFRIRTNLQQASVMQTFDGTTHFHIYLNRVPVPFLRAGTTNKLAILAIHHNHWFYINDRLVGQCSIPRFPRTRLDVGIAAGVKQRVSCQFQHFQVRVPPATHVYPMLEQAVTTFVE
jgi:transcriptional regulator with XRE-family HTH domain